MSSQKIRRPVGLTDLFPTICGLTGSEPPEKLDGDDLSAVVTGKRDAPENRPIYCDNLTPRRGESGKFHLTPTQCDGSYGNKENREKWQKRDSDALLADRKTGI